MGVAGKLNDNADITTDVRHYWPNDYGLYNMDGTMTDWYQPLLKMPRLGRF